MTEKKGSLYACEDENNKKYGWPCPEDCFGTAGPHGIAFAVTDISRSAAPPTSQGDTDSHAPQGAAGPSEPSAPSPSSGVTCFDGVPIEYTLAELAAFAEDPLRNGEWDGEDFWNND